MLNSNISHSSVVTVPFFFKFCFVFFCLFNSKKSSRDGNTLFWVAPVKLGVRGEEEGRVVCHPPLQVTTEGTSREENLSESSGRCQTRSSGNNVGSVTSE